MEFKGVDYTWALTYLALTMTPHERVDAGIQGILPRRKVPKNRPPTIKTFDLEEKLDRWWYPKPEKLLTPYEKRMIMGCVVQ